MPTDEELVLALRAGSQEAMEALIRRYHRPLFGYAHRLVRDRHQAQDIVQETFLRLCQNTWKIDRPQAVKTWLYRVLTRLAMDNYRGAANQQEVSSEEVWDRPSVTKSRELAQVIPFNEIVERREDRRRVKSALRSLDQRQRIVIFLRFYQDLSIDDIAEALEIPRGTVKSRLHYGLKALSGALRDQVSDAKKEVSEHDGS